MDELMLDGNAVAGMLGEVFAVEMTTATMTCGNYCSGKWVAAPRRYSTAEAKLYRIFAAERGDVNLAPSMLQSLV